MSLHDIGQCGIGFHADFAQRITLGDETDVMEIAPIAFGHRFT